MSIPATLSPEIAAWLRLQCTVAASRITQPLSAELADQDRFMNGLLIAVSQLVPAVLEASPEVAARLAPYWRHAAERYEALSAGAAPTDEDEAVELLEARQLLYRACEARNLWPAQGPRVTRVFMRPRHPRAPRVNH